MKARTIEIWVGLFVVMGICSLLMLALQVSGLSDFYQEEDGYKVVASFKHIGGLKIRSKVTINGVKIGRVTDIYLSRNEFNDYSAMVEMSLHNDYKNIPKDSAAKILTAGLLGDNYVSIEPGMEEEYLREGDTIELTQQALLLENLISKFAVGGNNGNKDK